MAPSKRKVSNRPVIGEKLAEEEHKNMGYVTHRHPKQYSIGDRIICRSYDTYYYPASIQKVETNPDGTVVYRVHYLGWSASHDEYLSHDQAKELFLPHVQQNIELAKKQREASVAQKRARARQKKSMGEDSRESSTASPMPKMLPSSSNVSSGRATPNSENIIKNSVVPSSSSRKRPASAASNNSSSSLSGEPPAAKRSKAAVEDGSAKSEASKRRSHKPAVQKPNVLITAETLSIDNESSSSSKRRSSRTIKLPLLDETEDISDSPASTANETSDTSVTMNQRASISDSSASTIKRRGPLLKLNKPNLSEKKENFNEVPSTNNGVENESTTPKKIKEVSSGDVLNQSKISRQRKQPDEKNTSSGDAQSPNVTTRRSRNHPVTPASETSNIRRRSTRSVRNSITGVIEDTSQPQPSPSEGRNESSSTPQREKKNILDVKLESDKGEVILRVEKSTSTWKEDDGTDKEPSVPRTQRELRSQSVKSRRSSIKIVEEPVNDKGKVPNRNDEESKTIEDASMEATTDTPQPEESMVVEGGDRPEVTIQKEEPSSSRTEATPEKVKSILQKPGTPDENDEPKIKKIEEIESSKLSCLDNEITSNNSNVSDVQTQTLDCDIDEIAVEVDDEVYEDRSRSASPSFCPRPYNGVVGLPEMFEEMLRRDKVYVKDEKKAIKCPPSVTIDEILDDYLQACLANQRKPYPYREMTNDDFNDFVNSLKANFRDYLKEDLLYESEVSQFIELEKNVPKKSESDYTFTDKYGLIHLIRWLSCFCYEHENGRHNDLIQSEIFPLVHDLINFLGSNVREYYIEDDYYLVKPRPS